MIIERDQLEGQLVGRDLAPAALAIAAASRLWSNAAARVPFAASTTMNSRAPAARSLRYQKRVLLSNQWGTIWSLRTSPAARAARQPRCWARTTGRLQEARGRCPQIRLRERQCPRHGQQRVGMLGAEPG